MEAIKNFFKKVWGGIKTGFFAVINFFKNVPWTQTVKPVIAYSVSGGALALAILIGVLVLCL